MPPETTTSSSVTNGLELEKAPLVDKSANNNNHERKRLSSTCSTVVIGILLTEAMESFAFYGSQIILVLYLSESLGYSEASSIALFSFLSSFADLTPILGAVLADGWLGRSKTILYFGALSTFGLLITTLGAMLSDDMLGGSLIKQGIANLMVWRKCLSFIGLILLFVGIGCIDPCLSSFGADQVVGKPSSAVGAANPEQNVSSEQAVQEIDIEKGTGENQTSIKKSGDSQSSSDERQVRVRAYFAYLYFCTNVGAVTSCGLVPLVREHDGFGMAFLVCAVCMVAGLCCFLSKRHRFVYSSSANKDPSTLASTFALCGTILSQRMSKTFQSWTCGSSVFWFEDTTTQPSLISMLESSDRGARRKSSSTTKNKDQKDPSYGACETKKYDSELVRDAEQALRVIPIMAMLPVFWMLYDQQESVWILQASRMTLHGLQPEQLSLVNPIQIMIFIPLFDRYLYPALTRCGWKLDPLARMGFGMVLAAAAFLVSGAMEIAIQRAEAHGAAPPSVLWQLIQITIMAVSEILVAVTGLEFSYSAAPARLKAFLMAVYSLTKAVGDLFGGVLYSTLFQEWNRATVMYVCAVLMLLNRVAFESVANDWYKSAPKPKPDSKESSGKRLTSKSAAQPNEKSSLLPH